MLDVIKNRRSVTSYDNLRDVEEDKLMEVLNAGRMAPSEQNLQPWKFIVVKDKEMKKGLAFVDHEQYWMLDAPVLVVCVANPTAWIGGDPIYVNEEADFMGLKRVIRDTSMAIMQMALEAENQGLSSCITAWYQQLDVRPLLDIPEDQYVVSILALGYGKDKPEERTRKEFDNIVCYEKWKS